MKPASRRSSVVLPQPEGPASVTNSPGSIVRSIRSSAGTAAPPTVKWCRTPRNSTRRWCRSGTRDALGRAGVDVLGVVGLGADGLDAALLQQEAGGVEQVLRELAPEVVS